MINFRRNVFFLFPQNKDGKEYEFKEVVQAPISPAYKEVLEKTKNLSLRHQNYLVKEEADVFRSDQ